MQWYTRLLMLTCIWSKHLVIAGKQIPTLTHTQGECVGFNFIFVKTSQMLSLPIPTAARVFFVSICCVRWTDFCVDNLQYFAVHCKCNSRFVPFARKTFLYHSVERVCLFYLFSLVVSNHITSEDHCQSAKSSVACAMDTGHCVEGATGNSENDNESLTIDLRGEIWCHNNSTLCTSLLLGRDFIVGSVEMCATAHRLLYAHTILVNCPLWLY